MKFAYLFILLLPLLLFGACKDAPRYAADELILMAKSLSPECSVPIETKSG